MAVEVGSWPRPDPGALPLTGQAEKAGEECPPKAEKPDLVSH